MRNEKGKCGDFGKEYMQADEARQKKRCAKVINLVLIVDISLTISKKGDIKLPRGATS